MLIMVVLVAVILILPLLFYGRTSKRIMPLYMAGANEGDNLTFKGAMDKDVSVSLRNWYMEGFFNERRMNRIGVIVTCGIFAVVFAFVATVGYMLVQSALGGGA
jgi:ech hydrogenase subunit A